MILKRHSFFLIIVLYSASFTGAFSKLQLVSPAVTDTVFIGENILIQWEGDEGRPVNLDYSTDMGAEWINIIQGYQGSSYSWEAPFLESVDIRFRITLDELIKPYIIWDTTGCHNAEVRSARISDDDALVVTSSDDDIIKIWDINSRTLIDSYTLSMSLNLYNARFHHGTDSIIAATSSGLFIWDRNAGSFELLSGSSFTDHVRSCASSIYQDIAFGASYDGSVKGFSTFDKSEIYNFPEPSNTEQYCVNYSPDGSAVIHSGYNGLVYFRYLDSPDPPVVLTGHGVNGQRLLVWTACVSPDNSLAASGGVDKTVRLWDLQTGNEIITLGNHSGQLRSVMFHPNSQYLLSAGLGDTLRQWRMSDYSEFTDVVIDHKGQILDAAYTLTGDSIITAGRDNGFKIWKNFEFTNDADSSEHQLRYRLRFKIPHIYSSVLSLEEIPMICERKKGYPEILSRLPEIDFRILIPNRLLFVDIPGKVKFSQSRNDTLIDKRAVVLNDTVYTFEGLVLQGDRTSEEIIIESINIPNDSIFYIETEDGSINIREECIGESGRAVSFMSYVPGINIRPNPVGNILQLDFKTVADGMVTIELYDERGAAVLELFNRNLKGGIYSITRELDCLISGVYNVRMVCPSGIFNQKMVKY